ncbi:MAG: DUF308 domain-containing protein [Spirochaetaceae bacterium]|jgi:uncharacterized membrane protein HdeD (DUF308 family)|nr:DUF308 domain-containing protein [Spirochaetaceae bacterium]
MKKSYIITGCVCILLGLVMLFAPQGFTSALVTAIGIAAIINGIMNIVSVRKLLEDTSYRRIIMVRAVISIIVGVIAVFAPLILAGAVWTVIIYILAAELIVSALLEFYGTWKLKNAGYPYQPYLIEAVISIIVAAILFAIPAAIGITIIRILGVIVILAGAGGIIWSLKYDK